jgi:hypothetical protein
MNGYVPVYVPERHLPTILAQLTALISKHEAVSAAPESATMELSRWSEKMIRDVFLDVTDNMRKVFVALAERPGERLTVGDLERQVGSEGAVHPALSSLTKRAKKHGIHGPGSWPFDAHKDPRTGRYSYEMDVDTAAVVLKVHEWLEQTLDQARSRARDS